MTSQITSAISSGISSGISAIKDAGNPFLRLVNNVTGDISTTNVPYFQAEQLKEAAFQSALACDTIHKGLHARLDSINDIVIRKTLECCKLLLLEGPNPQFQTLLYTQSAGKILGIANIKRNDPNRFVPKDSILEGNINLAAAIHRGMSGDISSLSSYGLGQQTRSAMGTNAAGGGSGGAAAVFKSDFQAQQEREQKNFKKRREEERARLAGMVTTEKMFEQFDATLSPQKLVDYAVNHAKKKFAPEELDNFVEAVEDGGKIEEVCACLDKVLRDGKSALQNRYKVLTIVDVMIRQLTPALQWFQNNNAGIYRHVALEAGDNPTKSALMQQLSSGMMDVVHGKIKVPASAGLVPVVRTSRGNSQVGPNTTAATPTPTPAAAPTTTANSIDANQQQIMDMMAKMQAMQAQLQQQAAGGAAVAAAPAPAPAPVVSASPATSGWGSTTGNDGWGATTSAGASTSAGGWGDVPTASGWGAPAPAATAPTPAATVVAAAAPPAAPKRDALDDLFDTSVPAPAGPSSFGFGGASNTTTATAPATSALPEIAVPSSNNNTRMMGNDSLASPTEFDQPQCPANSFNSPLAGGMAALMAQQQQQQMLAMTAAAGGNGSTISAAPSAADFDSYVSPSNSANTAGIFDGMSLAQQQQYLVNAVADTQAVKESMGASDHTPDSVVGAAAVAAATAAPESASPPVMPAPLVSSINGGIGSACPSSPAANEADAALLQMQQMQQKMAEMMAMMQQQQQAAGLLGGGDASLNGGAATTTSMTPAPSMTFSPSTYYAGPMCNNVTSPLMPPTPAASPVGGVVMGGGGGFGFAGTGGSFDTTFTPTPAAVVSKRPEILRLMAKLEEQMNATKATMAKQQACMAQLQAALAKESF